ncbi:MAG: hypothetical protein A3D92_00160 [Bacteroidetes bacterium RIFCSPHIGHO2_02_FULL_44_7]|nr:MAG: hypothetical protein A3D92_00160 [Bacteroidetes bacterium RIFCSPHIGHO2_02_FULL_44_7]
MGIRLDFNPEIQPEPRPEPVEGNGSGFIFFPFSLGQRTILSAKLRFVIRIRKAEPLVAEPSL